MKRVLLIADVASWAWHYRCLSLQKYAPHDYEVEVVIAEQYIQKPDWYAQNYDSAWFCSWTSYAKDFVKIWKRKSSLVTCHGIEFNKSTDQDWRSLATTPSRRNERAKQRLPWFDSIIVPNSQLYEVVRKINPNTVLIPSGVDCDVFCPQPHTPSADGRLRVGWCANPLGKHSVKGMEQILKPLTQQLGSEKYDWRINDRNYQNALPRSEMVKWYADLDVLISTSIVEGTPSPVQESSACGRATLCTAVGVWQDFSEAKRLGCVAPAYHNQETANKTIDWFVYALQQLERDRNDCHWIGSQLAEAVRARFDYRELASKHLQVIAGE